MKRFVSFIILAILLALPSCGEKCQHLYTKWSMDAEEHWISCDLCGQVEIESAPHDWVVISTENANGVGVVTSMCAMCGQTATDNLPVDREVTNEEWDAALAKSRFENVTVHFMQKDGGEVNNAVYYICGEQVKEELWQDGKLEFSHTVDATLSNGKSYLLSTLSPFVDTFGGFEYDGDRGVYCYERIEEDGSTTSFTFGFEFERLTYCRLTSGDEAYVSEFSFSDYGKTSLE